MSRILLAAALAAAAALPARADAAVLICVAPRPDLYVCSDGTRPLCVYGAAGQAAFETAWC